jgi:hypothetical protein
VKWYIVTIHGLYVKKTFATTKDAVEVIAKDYNDQRKKKRLTKLGEGLYQYFHNSNLLFIMEENYAINNGYEWVTTEVQIQK